MRPVVRGFATLSVAILLAACSGGGSPTAAPTAAPTTAAATTAPVVTPEPTKICNEPADAATPADVEASVGGFAWGAVTAKVGDVITWSNGDGVPHKVVLDTEHCSMDGNIPGGGTRSLIFDKAGTFAFHCGVHGQMPGEMTITP